MIGWLEHLLFAPVSNWALAVAIAFIVLMPSRWRDEDDE